MIDDSISMGAGCCNLGVQVADASIVDLSFFGGFVESVVKVERF